MAYRWCAAHWIEIRAGSDDAQRLSSVAGYQPTGTHGYDECKDNYTFWLPASLFAPR